MRKKLLLREEGTSDLGGSSIDLGGSSIDLGGSSIDLGGSSVEGSSCSCAVIVKKLEDLEGKMMELNADNCQPYCAGGSSCVEANPDNCVEFCPEGCSVDVGAFSEDFTACLQNNGSVSCATFGTSIFACLCSASEAS